MLFAPWTAVETSCARAMDVMPNTPTGVLMEHVMPAQPTVTHAHGTQLLVSGENTSIFEFATLLYRNMLLLFLQKLLVIIDPHQFMV